MTRTDKDSVTISTTAQAASFRSRSLIAEPRVCMSRRALRNIITTVGARPAESGGILLGPIGADSISDFVFDEEGSVSMVTYSPSHRKLTMLCEAASVRGYELKGFCHSHPGLKTPSLGDLRYVERFFEENPGLRKFYLPILPVVPLNGSPKSLAHCAEHIEFYVILREAPSHYEKAIISLVESQGCADHLPKEETPPGVLTDMNLSRLSNLLGGVSIAPSTVDISGKQVACLSITSDDTEVLLFLPSEFPFLSPSVIVTRSGKKAEQYHSEWAVEHDCPSEERLAKLVKVVLANRMFSTRSF